MEAVVLAALTVLVAVAFSLGANRLVQRFTSPGREYPGASDLLGALFSIYGILLSLVIVAVWDDYQRAREITAAEASATVDVARAVESLPPPLGPEVAREVIAYYNQVLASELPAMAHGRASPEISLALEAVWKKVATFAPVTEREKNLHELALNRLIELGNQRRLRLIANERRLPALLWAVIFVGGVMVVGFSSLLGARAARTLALRLAVAGLIGLIVFTIYALEYPFRDPLRIDASDIQTVRRLVTPRGS